MQEVIEVIKIGGPTTAVSVIFLWFFDRVNKRTTILIENHLKHETDAINKNTVVLEHLSTLIEHWMKKKKL